MLMTDKEIISIGKKILDIETSGIKKLKSSLSKDFAKVVKLILNNKKKVIFTGLGKSGYIARKISSSFTSTGITSIYLHPSEASHGDLGLINKEDILILISNSGETKEIFDILNFAKYKDIKVISITSEAKSTISRNSLITLILPKSKEADKLGIIPTTSTTMCLALGDALCCTILNYRQFNKKSFKDFHPGGKLGKNLNTLADVMNDDLPLLTINKGISEAIILMSEKKYGCVIVCNNQKKIIGIITDGDLRRAFEKNQNFINLFKISDIMNSNPVLAKKDFLVTSAINLMNKNSITSLIIADQKRPIGIVNLKECLLSV